MHRIQIGPDDEVIPLCAVAVLFDLPSARNGYGVGDVEDLGSLTARQPQVFDEDVQTQVGLEAGLLGRFELDWAVVIG